MRPRLKLAAYVLVLSLCGCVVPVGDVTTIGHKYSKGALAFLDLPGTTREEVIATLGAPDFESREMRILMYEWERAARYLSVSADDFTHPSKFDGDPHEWALLIAYDTKGIVCAHEIRRLDQQKLAEACAEWYRQRNNKP